MRVGGEIGVTIRGDNRPYKQVLEDSKRDTKKFEDQVEKSTENAEKAFYELGHKIGESMRTGISKAGNALTLGITLPILAATKTAISAASDLEESTSKVGVTFGNAKKHVEAFGKTTAEAYGISKRAAFDYASTFGGILRETKLGEEAMAAMSIQLTKLGGDLASFKNIKPEEALEKLRAGLTGEYEPLKNIGYVLNEAAVAAKAAEMGFKGKTKELSESQKMLARYAIILEKTTDAQGDANRTQDSAANQARKVKAAFEELSAEFGTELLPLTKDVLKWTREMLGGLKDLEPAQRQQILKWIGIAAAAGPALKLLSGFLTVTRGIIALRTAYVGAQAAMATSTAAAGTAAAGATASLNAMRLAYIGLAAAAAVPIIWTIKAVYDFKGAADSAYSSTRNWAEQPFSFADYIKGQRDKGAKKSVSELAADYKKTQAYQQYENSPQRRANVRAYEERQAAASSLDGLEEQIRRAFQGLNGLGGTITKGGVRGATKTSGMAPANPFGIDETLKAQMEEAQEAARKLAEEVGEWFISLRRQVFEHGGQRSRVESFLFDRKNDPSSVAAKMGPLDLIKALGGLSSMDKVDAQAEREAQLKDRQKQIEAIREQARESGVLAGIEDTLLKLEQKKGSAFFAYHADRAQAEVKTLILQKEQTAAAQEYIRGLREELGLEKQLTELQKLQSAVSAGGRMASADAGDKFKAMFYAMAADAKRFGPFQQSQVIDTGTSAAAERYKDTIRDLAIEMGGLGDITGVTSERLRLLGQGMSDVQAQHVIDTQRRLREMQELTNIVREGADSMAGVLLDSFKAIGGGFDDMLTTLAGGFRATLAEMAADYLRSQFRRMIFGLVGNLFAGGFGGNPNGASDTGQSMVSGGGQGIVTARGPSPSIVVNMPIHTPDVGGFKRSQAQVTSEMVAIALQELKRSG